MISLNKLKESKISKISFSLCLFKGSIFSLKVPSKIKGSCETIVIFCLRESKLILLISVSSINIFPSKDSKILHIDNIKVDFPLPVLIILKLIFHSQFFLQFQFSHLDLLYNLISLK